MRCLLDKATARYAVQGLLKLAEGRDLTEQELFTLDLLSQSQPPGTRLFIAPPSSNVARNLAQLPRYSDVIYLFLSRVEVALPARYFRRWVRRLRDYGFTHEDAAILALATFGTDKEGAVLGMDFVATYDRPMIQHWSGQREAIQERLAAMCRDIPPPYHHAFLPRVLPPELISMVPMPCANEGR
jgi:hypothetical protein